MEFEYTRVQGHLADGTLTAPSLPGYEAIDERTVVVSNSPPINLDADVATLMDINSDGLSDLLVTAPALFNGQHGAYLNGAGATVNGTAPFTAASFGERTIRVDGVLDEAFWSTLDPVSDFVQRDPVDGAFPSEPTEVRIAYDQGEA